MSGRRPALRIVVDSDLDQVAPVGRAVRALCAEVLAPDEVDAVELALAEAMNNVILHGHDGEAGHEIHVSVELGAGEVRLTLSDTGRPIPDGLLDAAGATRFDFDPGAPADLPQGGMGLALIRMSMDEVAYRSGGGRNRLEMAKRARAPRP